jgi:GPH family glycoside/pentoside/hexuronide:cation symporter
MRIRLSNLAVEPETRALPAWKPAAWGIGQIAGQMFRDVPSLLLLFYMTQVLGINPALAGTAIFVPKLILAVIFDYGVGVASDRWRDRFQRRHFLLIGAVLSPLALVLLFGTPGAAGEMGKALHVSIVLALYMAVYAIFSVPHFGIGAELSDNPSVRTAVMAWRVAFSGAGLLIGNAIAPRLIESRGGGAAGYEFMALVLAGICAVSLVISWFGSGEAPRPQAARGQAKPTGNLAAFLHDPNALAVLGALLLTLTASGLAYATLVYLFTFNLAFETPFAILSNMVLITAVTAMAIQPVWVKVINRIGKKTAFILASFGYSAGLIVMTIGGEGVTWTVYLAGLLMGMFNSATYLASLSMLTDVIEADRTRTGISRSGFYSALFAVVDKIGFALGGTLLAGLALSAFGFEAAKAQQTETALSGVVFAFAWAPTVLNTAALLVLWRFYRLKTGPSAA